MDGHTGLENKELLRLTASPYELVLASNTETGGEQYFVIHAHSSTRHLGTIHPLDFLNRVGFVRSNVTCKFFPDICVYKYLVVREPATAHQRLERYRATLPSLYSKAQEIYRELGSNIDLFPWAVQFQERVPAIDLSGVPPPWIDAYKVEQHKATERTLVEHHELDKHFQTIEYLLWGTGDPLADAVTYTLQDMALDAKKTEKAYNIDATLSIPAIPAEFGVEVTGISNAINKRSPKINQLLKFEQEKHGKERALLIANTFNEIPVKERESKESFTKDALEVLTRLRVVCLTTPDLYAIWRDTKFGGKNAVEIFRQVNAFDGGQWRYSSE